MTVIVKCKFCGETIKLARKPKLYFRHCDIAQGFDENSVLSELTIESRRVFKKPKKVPISRSFKKENTILNNIAEKNEVVTIE